MAAVLCKGIGGCFSVLCDCTGKICHTICVGPCKVCASACEVLGDACNSPFACFTIITMICQLPPIFVGFMELAGLPDCRGSLWLIGAILLGVVNIAAAFYLAIKIKSVDDPNMQHLRTAYSRATYLLCHDPWMAAYILLFLVYIVWSCLGASWSWSGLMDEDESCSDSILSSIQIAAGFGWFFLFGGSAALAMSVCCACCDTRDYGSSSQPTPDVENPYHAASSPQQQQQPFASHASQSNQEQQPSYKKYAKTSNSTTQQPTTYSADGVPVNAEPDENGIPVAHAEAVPSPMPPPQQNAYATASPLEPSATSAPPAEYDSSKSKFAASTSSASGEPGARAPATASSTGSAMGKKIGKLFKVDDVKQQQYEENGKKAGDAVGKGYGYAKNFVQSKMKKDTTTTTSK